MPELPEVETIRRQLAPELIGAEIIGADTHGSAKFTPGMEAVGSEITGLNRRGKYLLFELDDGRELIGHLGMTGSFTIIPEEDVPGLKIEDHGPHVRALWHLEDGRHLRFKDIRRFGGLHVVNAGDYGAIATLAAMGPEPLGDDFDGAHLHRAIQGSRRAIKTQLLSQRPVAGVGNIYADEALFIAKIHPQANRIGRDRCDRLAAAVKDVLADGIAHGGTTLRDYVDAQGATGSHQKSLQVYGRRGEPCPNCGEPLTAIVLDARTTTYCRHCQRR